jgi:hypothetical protein
MKKPSLREDQRPGQRPAVSGKLPVVVPPGVAAKLKATPELGGPWMALGADRLRKGRVARSQESV